MNYYTLLDSSRSSDPGFCNYFIIRFYLIFLNTKILFHLDMNNGPWIQTLFGEERRGERGKAASCPKKIHHILSFIIASSSSSCARRWPCTTSSTGRLAACGGAKRPWVGRLASGHLDHQQTRRAEQKAGEGDDLGVSVRQTECLSYTSSNGYCFASL